jgi:hypothetical protein
VAEGLPPRFGGETEKAAQSMADTLSTEVRNKIAPAPDTTDTAPGRVLGVFLAVDLNQPGADPVRMRRPIVSALTEGGPVDEAAVAGLAEGLMFESRLGILTSLYTPARLDWEIMNVLPDVLAFSRAALRDRDGALSLTALPQPPILPAIGKALSASLRGLELPESVLHFAAHPTVIAEHAPVISDGSDTVRAIGQIDLVRIGYQTMSSAEAQADGLVAARTVGLFLTAAEQIEPRDETEDAIRRGFATDLIEAGQIIAQGAGRPTTALQARASDGPALLVGCRSGDRRAGRTCGRWIRSGQP